MIKAILEIYHKRFRIPEHIGSAPNTGRPHLRPIINVTFIDMVHPQTNQPLYLATSAPPGQGSHKAYYLPWESNTGYHIDLPTIGDGHPTLFLTAELSGCCISVQHLDNIIRVRHYNLSLPHTETPFSMIDFFRYGATKWLLPENYAAMMPGATIYTHAGGFNPASCWGEFKVNKWFFYYQNHNSIKVHEF